MSREIGLHLPDSKWPKPRAPVLKLMHFAIPFALVIEQLRRGQQASVL